MVPIFPHANTGSLGYPSPWGGCLEDHSFPPCSGPSLSCSREALGPGVPVGTNLTLEAIGESPHVQTPVPGRKKNGDLRVASPPKEFPVPQVSPPLQAPTASALSTRAQELPSAQGNHHFPDSFCPQGAAGGRQCWRMAFRGIWEGWREHGGEGVRARLRGWA